MNLFSNKDLGLLIIRLGLGIMFVIHGFPMLMGGPTQWVWIGSQMSNLGIVFLPGVWGFLAAATEFFGGVCLIVGFKQKIASFLLAFTMLVATLYHFAKGEGINGAAHAIEVGLVFLGLIFTGTGKYGVDAS